MECNRCLVRQHKLVRALHQLLELVFLPVQDCRRVEEKIDDEEADKGRKYPRAWIILIR